MSKNKIPYCGGCEARREPNDNGDCPKCGTLIQFVRLDATHNNELRELIDEMNRYGDRDVDRFAAELRGLIGDE